MPTELLLKLADIGAVGLMLALSLTALVWTTRTLLDFMKDRIAFYEQGLIVGLQSLQKDFVTHDEKSADVHKRQEEAIARVEQEVRRHPTVGS